MDVISVMREDMVEKFLKSRRTGFYFALAREGEIGAGNTVHFFGRDRLKSAGMTLRMCYNGR